MSSEAKEKGLVPAYIWFDSEFTSLDVKESYLLQVAMVITDVHFQRVFPASDDVNISVKLPDGARVSDWVMQHIPDLVDKSRSAEAVNVYEVDNLLAASVDRAVGDAETSISCRPVLAGNSIHADMAVVRKWLPAFTARLNYRMLDVSTVKLLVNNTFNMQPFDKENAEMLQLYLLDGSSSMAGQAHDAGFDVKASIAEMRYYEGLFSRQRDDQ